MNSQSAFSQRPGPPVGAHASRPVDGPRSGAGHAPGGVAVVVVNWNGRVHLERCLPALADQTLSPDQVVVVDNGSTDGSVEWLRRAFPDVVALALGANTGFAAANNRGIEATNAEWVALLNNDTVPDAGWLAGLVASAAAEPRIGSVASRMLFLDDPGTINSAGIAVDPTGIAWDRLGGAPASAGDAPCEVFGASAGAALYLRAALQDACETLPGGRTEVFDARYFMYLEDVDLAWRLRLRGWRGVYAPDAIVLHHGSATAREGSAFKNRLLARNKIWTVLKDYPTAPLAGHAPAIVAYDLASAPYRLLAQGQTAAVRGRMDAARDLRRVLARRRAVQARRTSPWSEIRAAMADLEPPWAVLRRYRHLSTRR